MVVTNFEKTNFGSQTEQIGNPDMLIAEAEKQAGLETTNISKEKPKLDIKLNPSTSSEINHVSNQLAREFAEIEENEARVEFLAGDNLEAIKYIVQEMIKQAAHLDDDILIEEISVEVNRIDLKIGINFIIPAFGSSSYKISIQCALKNNETNNVILEFDENVGLQISRSDGQSPNLGDDAFIMGIKFRANSALDDMKDPAYIRSAMIDRFQIDKKYKINQIYIQNGIVIDVLDSSKESKSRKDNKQ